MDLLCFETYEDMACDVFGVLYEVTKEDEFNDIAIIAKYEEARQIIKELLCIGCEIKSIDLHDAEYDRYDAEYIISVVMNEEDKECEIWCEPMLRENGYITVENEGHLVLTEKGLEIANKMYERHQLLSRWLIYMGVSEETALEDACRMEHVISVESFDAMKRHFAAVQELLPKNR